MSIDEQTKLLTEIRDILQGHHERLVKIDSDNAVLQQRQLDFQDELRRGSAWHQARLKTGEKYLLVLTLLGFAALLLLCLNVAGIYRLSSLFGG